MKTSKLRSFLIAADKLTDDTALVQLSCKDDVLVVFATSGVSLVWTCDHIGPAFNVLVGAAELKKALAKTPNVEFAYIGGALNVIKPAGVTRVIATPTDTMATHVLDTPADAQSSLTLKERIGRIKHAICTDSNRESLCGIHVSPTFLTATNGHTLSRTKHGLQLHEMLCYDFSKALGLLSKGKVSVWQTQGALHLTQPGIEICARRLDQRFPNVDKVLPTFDEPTHVIADRKGLLWALEPLRKAADRESRQVLVDVADGQVDFVAVTNEIILGAGAAAPCTGPDLSLALNVDYLIATIKVLRTDDIQLAKSDALTPVLFFDGDDQHVIMPMRREV